MREEKKMICGLPALELGEPSERVFFYVHGKWGARRRPGTLPLRRPVPRAGRWSASTCPATASVRAA